MEGTCPGPVPDARQIAEISFHNAKPTHLRGDVLWFGVIYVFVLLIALYSSLMLYLFPVVIGFHGLSFLACVWSVRIRCFLRYTPSPSVEGAGFVCVVAAPHCGLADICPISSTVLDKTETLCFSFQRSKYILQTSGENEGKFAPLALPVDRPLRHYARHQGHSPASAEAAINEFGPNLFDIPLPTFRDLYLEHAAAPFFVFQIFCVALWCLDEYWYYSIITLIMLLAFEATVVERRLKNLGELRSMRVPPYQVLVHRAGKWTSRTTIDLVPGDLVSITRSDGDNVVPCDVLLLGGSCVVNEALLTGESVPQQKETLDVPGTGEDRLQFTKEHKRHVVWGGTKVLLAHSPKASTEEVDGSVPNFKLGVKPPSDGGAVGYVLRTGFHTSQGNLIRTILFSSERVSVNTAESLYFILVLLVFALVASSYVLYQGLQDPDRSRYKLMLNCIMIITSVVPPELPMELSLAVNTSLISLVKDRIFCTEPFRIPLAGSVDVCCFDKTGTLTSDNFVVEGVAGVPGQLIGRLWNAKETPRATQLVLASCHSLSRIKGELIGDPLELAAFGSIPWTMPSNGSILGPTKVRIVRRFPFSSVLKRMASVVCVGQSDYMLTAKGAPEVMESLFSDTPEHYEATHQYYSRKGYRLLALGHRPLQEMMDAEGSRVLQTANRADMESGLVFDGFLVLSCPIKADSASVIEQLVASTHGVVMITGDHALTACSVARQVGIINRKPLLLQTGEDAETQGNTKSSACRWVSTDRAVEEAFDTACDETALAALCGQYSLCLTGPALDHLRTATSKGGVGLSAQQAGYLCSRVSVFARTSPDQKEFVITSLKNLGKTTLMCGDGTNDVGALKQAHVGVALIGVGQDGPPTRAQTPPPKRRPTKEEFRKEQERKRAELMAQGQAQQVRLGDASIAAPFTSKLPYVSSCISIIRQGRCTLVTTLQMYKILALNCLISAYAMSVLYLDGVKLGDTQMTVASLGVAMYFLFISRSKPLSVLSAQRPDARIFSKANMISLFGQFAVHMYVLMLAVSWAKPHTPTDKDTKDPEGDFSPNVINTVVFLVTTSMTSATFLANYQGLPFMESLRDNKPLLYSLGASLAVVYLCCLDIIPGLAEGMELAPLPSPEFRVDLLLLMIVDLLITLAYAKGVEWLRLRAQDRTIVPKQMRGSAWQERAVDIPGINNEPGV